MEDQEIVIAGTSDDGVNSSRIHKYFLGVIVALLIGVGAVAWLFRYEPLSQSANGSLVWDRWAHRFCAAFLLQGRQVLQCNEAEASVVGDQSNKPTAAAPAPLFPSGQAGLPKWQTDLPKLRAAGFSEKEIGELAANLRNIMKVRGTPQDQIDAYFGDYQFPP